MKKTLIPLILITHTIFLIAAERDYQPVNMITIPTAGVLERGSYNLDFRLFPNGGLWGAVSVGISDRFMFGVSYGGGNIIGDQKVNWYNQPGVEIKYRLFEEDQKMPAIVLGFNSQGFGNYLDSLKRFETKAYGFYAAASKNFKFLGNWGIHGGINYNPLETGDKDRDPNIFLGMDKSINPEITLMCEYNAGINDNRKNIIYGGKGKGYLNAGIRWQVVEKLSVEVDFNNLLLNRNQVKYFTREIKIIILDYF